MILYKSLPTEIRYKNRKYKIKPYFNNVLFCLEVFNNNAYTDEEKIYLCYKALIKKQLAQHNYTEVVAILSKVFDVLFEDKNKRKENKKSFDFTQDAKYIYAGFMQCYGINLFEYKNKLHWWEFNALFQGLSRDTRIMQIIDIRTRPIPRRDKTNGEYINNLLKQKAEYKLELSQEEQEKEIQQSLGDLFSALSNMAEKE
ncbi:Gp15 family bacteriophage protein [Thomasclavelia ramosa]|uniref:Gp15 family bacteriophage protein n=1 Tax=Thomasclavelia ramosa TaxID=1547 RepID=UPI001D05CB37|nr:Gp15 family bacteriophage protein [Thomasclavelia ramosa]MCB6436528.1 bacteriophage Gp15 family protein [Thomasclavelia ramosa]MCB6459578.1 bacteriophage Gp15 family protein [Thomasclavelia ramosa]MCB6599015.1 bacteriophage Gp15 family protein [Thomasclavelia ramosa]MCB6601428.1 bacteriophage Gp15 family protein [Thomasclavelia ramosa]MCB6619930.1 bacteriophage Gp15 family protein [Thomasclavelia ramosa]